MKETLFRGALDIVGDVHGEIDALHDLLRELGYSETGEHAEGRHLVFVGDLVDLGPDSPAVLKLVRTMVQDHRAKCVLGDHELQLLLGERTPDNLWWFDSEQANTDSITLLDQEDRPDLKEFLLSLPLVLGNKSVEIVHAGWNAQLIDDMVFGYMTLRVPEFYDQLENRIHDLLDQKDLVAQAAIENDQYGELLIDPNWFPRFLPAAAEATVKRRMCNTVRLITSGTLGPSDKPFWDGDKWSMVKPTRWWDKYAKDKVIIIGHYSRWWNSETLAKSILSEPNLLAGVEPCDWMGRRENVFCVDYSVGARAEQRAKGLNVNACRLAALRFPEWEVVFDDGQGYELGPPKLTWR